MSAQEKSLGNVWIVGASSGIGQSLAEKCAPLADNVAISARSVEKLEQMERENPSFGAFPVDTSDQAAVEQTAEAIEKRYGGIDTAVLCAAVWFPMRADDLDTDKMHQAMTINYFGAVYAVKALISGMKARGSGHIVIVSSVAGYRGLPSSLAYGPTKAALTNLAEALAVELGEFGIKVTLVQPGFVDTPMSRVNKFPMPGLMDVDAAAEKLLSGILQRKNAIFFPRLFTTAVRLTNFLPYWLFYALSRRMISGRRNR
ncbi:SDR family NAD(P)-dependent oxidoreductase [Hoeflea prorocentri]|uniref:SDR family NAD(P)-dependent oxidoreductase n=1 Tax=Hoeflea prorocentri TaxID=1922333 RepID=A0A9X3UK04_9HYPH|nr:SDR family NAD(P)-dependent oxidoreductase [Hoeflea prorocentri]MCY6382225.1 SDR family NAD(P)-dependent oxidoreductase [Hoeflea prorocentri]MDA5400025.1 SDR family NAD(P)-dependent oxidoreductase [Hoeflea prorocentri]